MRRERDQGRRRRQGRRPEAPERRVGLGPPLSRGCACLSLTARLSTLGCWSGGFCRRSTLQPPWGVAQATPQSNPRRPRRHLVAAPTPAPCHPAPWWARAVPLELQDLQPRWAPWLWRRPSANSVGQRAALFGRGSSLSPTRAIRARLRLIEKNPGHVWYHNSG